jgi:hypothetical protein
MPALLPCSHGTCGFCTQNKSKERGNVGNLETSLLEEDEYFFKCTLIAKIDFLVYTIPYSLPMSSFVNAEPAL